MKKFRGFRNKTNTKASENARNPTPTMQIEYTSHVWTKPKVTKEKKHKKHQSRSRQTQMRQNSSSSLRGSMSRQMSRQHSSFSPEIVSEPYRGDSMSSYGRRNSNKSRSRSPERVETVDHSIDPVE